MLLALAALGVPTEARPKKFQRAMGVIFEMILAECGRPDHADARRRAALSCQLDRSTDPWRCDLSAEAGGSAATSSFPPDSDGPGFGESGFNPPWPPAEARSRFRAQEWGSKSNGRSPTSG